MFVKEGAYDGNPYFIIEKNILTEQFDEVMEAVEKKISKPKFHSKSGFTIIYSNGITPAYETVL